MDENFAKPVIFGRSRGVDKVFFGCYNKVAPRKIGAYNWIKKDAEYSTIVTLTGKLKWTTPQRPHMWASEKAYVPDRNNNVFRFAMTHDWYDDTSAWQLIGIWDVDDKVGTDTCLLHMILVLKESTYSER